MSKTVLIVEDNDMLREGLSEMLVYEGFDVLTARNGKDVSSLKLRNRNFRHPKRNIVSYSKMQMMRSGFMIWMAKL